MPAPEPELPTVFVSYHPADQKSLKRVQTALAPLVREEIRLWDHTKIVPGQRRDEEIRRALAASQVGILLLSPDYVASDELVGNELRPLIEAEKERDLVILPVIVKPHSPIGSEGLPDVQPVNPHKPLAKITSYQRDEGWENWLWRSERQ